MSCRVSVKPNNMCIYSTIEEPPHIYWCTYIQICAKVLLKGSIDKKNQAGFRWRLCVEQTQSTYALLGHNELRVWMQRSYPHIFFYRRDAWQYRSLYNFTRLISTYRLTHLLPGAAYMRQWVLSALFQIVACRLFGTKALLKPIGPLGTNFSEIVIKTQHLLFTKMHLKISSTKWRPFCPGGKVLTSPAYIRRHDDATGSHHKLTNLPYHVRPEAGSQQTQHITGKTLRNWWNTFSTILAFKLLLGHFYWP